jgi:CRP-like cAMP-binding protein
MTIEEDIAFLERVPMLQRLGAGALRILAIGAESYSVGAEQVLFVAGDSADCAYVVQQGSFLIQPDAPNEPETVAEPGALLGETALLIESPRRETVTARVDSIVLRISRTMFHKMLESNAEAAQRLRDIYASRNDQFTRELQRVRDVLARGTGPQ